VPQLTKELTDNIAWPKAFHHLYFATHGRAHWSDKRDTKE